MTEQDYAQARADMEDEERYEQHVDEFVDDLAIETGLARGLLLDLTVADVRRLMARERAEPAEPPRRGRPRKDRAA